MSDEGKLNLDTARAVQAEAVLNNDLIREAYERIEADLFEQWVSTSMHDTQGRERLWAAVQANRRHQGYMLSVISNGKMAAAELSMLAKIRR